MKTIMFNSQKGGTGKTTLATLTGAFMASEGARVLMIDLDPQGHVARSFGLNKEHGLFQVMQRGDDIIDWLREPDPERWTLNGKPKGKLYILPGDEETGVLPNLLNNPYSLAELTEDVEDLFDVCIFDTNPSAGALLGWSYFASDYIVIPTALEFLSLDGVAQTITTAKRANVELIGIVPNNVKHTVLHQTYAKTLAEAAQQNGWTILPTIYDRIEWAEASALNTIIYSVHAKMSKARVEAIRLAQIISQRMGIGAAAHG